MNTRVKNGLTPILTLILFVLLFSLGLRIAELRPLWNDEIFTQLHSVQNKSYGDIMEGNIPEGNNFPLFYIIQKLIIQSFQFELPKNWEGVGYGAHDLGQIILRLQGNLVISLTLCLVFYFLSYHFYFFWGMYTLFLFLSSGVIWVYWAEARPYGLWIFITALHTLIVLKITWMERISKKWWLGLFIVQLLLSLTALFGIVQSMLATFTLGLLNKKNKQVLYYQCPHLILIGIFYYRKALHFDMWFDSNPVQILRSVASEELLIIPIIYAFSVAVVYFLKKKDEKFIQSLTHFKFTLFSYCIYIFALTLMAFFILKSTGGSKGFIITSRYFVFIIPTIILSQALCAIDLLNMFHKNVWLRINIFILLIFVVLHNFCSNQFVIHSLTNLYLTF